MKNITVSVLQIIYGTISLVYGKNGNGKSIILKSMNGTYHRKNEQQIHVKNTPCVVLNEDYLEKPLYSSYYSNNIPIRMSDKLTVRQYVSYYLKCLQCNDKYKCCPKFIYEECPLIFNEFYLNIIDEEVSSLSDGSKNFLKLVLFALTNIFTPIWLLDEPFANLNADIVQLLCNFFKHINKQYGTTIIITTHHYPPCLMDIIDMVSYVKDRNVEFLYPKTLWYKQLSGFLQMDIVDNNVDMNMEKIMNRSSEIQPLDFYKHYRTLPLYYRDNCNFSSSSSSSSSSCVDFKGLQSDTFSYNKYFKSVLTLFTFRLQIDINWVFIISLGVCVILMTLFRHLDNFIYIELEQIRNVHTDIYFFDLMNICVTIITNFILSTYICFLFQNEFYHCNIEIDRGLYSSSTLFMYRLLYGLYIASIVITIGVIVDLVQYDYFTIPSYLFHSFVSIIISVMVGAMLNFVFKNVYIKLVIIFCMMVIRICLVERLVQFMTYTSSSKIGERFYYIILSIIDGGFANFVTFACDFRSTYLKERYNLPYSPDMYGNNRIVVLQYLYIIYDSFIHITAYITLITNICILFLLGLFLYKKFTYVYNGL